MFLFVLDRVYISVRDVFIGALAYINPQLHWGNKNALNSICAMPMKICDYHSSNNRNSELVDRLWG